VELLQNLPDGEPAEQWSGQFQGDIIISERQLREFAERKGRTGLVETRFRWPNDTVPVLIVDGYFGGIGLTHNVFELLTHSICRSGTNRLHSFGIQNYPSEYINHFNLIVSPFIVLIKLFRTRLA